MKTFTKLLHACPPESLPGLTESEVPIRSRQNIERLVMKGIRADNTKKPSASKRSRSLFGGALAPAAAIMLAAAVGLTVILCRGGIDLTEPSGTTAPDGIFAEVTTDEGVTLSLLDAIRSGDETTLKFKLGFPETGGEFLLYENLSLKSGNLVLMEKPGCKPESAGNAIMAGDIFNVLPDDDRTGCEFELTFEGYGELTLCIDKLYSVATEDAVECEIFPIAERLELSFTIDSAENTDTGDEDGAGDNIIYSNTVTSGDVTLTAVESFNDGDNTYLRFRLDFPAADGDFLLYEGLTLGASDRELIDQVGSKPESAGSAIMAGDIFRLLTDETRSGFEFLLSFPGDANVVTLCIDNLYSVATEDAVECETFPIADQLELTFSVKQLSKPLGVTSAEPMTQSELPGAELTLKQMKHTPLGLELTVGLTRSELYAPTPDTPIEFENYIVLPQNYRQLTEDQRNVYSENCYDFILTYRDESGNTAELDSYSSGRFSYLSENSCEFIVTFTFDSPIGYEDLQSIYIISYAAQNNDSDGEPIVIWEN